MRLQKRWLLPEPAESAHLPGFSSLESRILARRRVRDVDQAEAFLDRSYQASTDPFDMQGMDQAVARLREARQHSQQVVVYGDYDADGVTATVLLYEWLRQAGFAVSWYIPDRFQEGYGLNIEAINLLRSDGAELVVTVDCGIRSLAEVELGRRLGLDFILTDHHIPGQDLPSASAVLNPKQYGDVYPFKAHAGVGLAYKLAEALGTALRIPGPRDMLELVALGTVADLAPLLGENRSLVAAGLEQLNASRRPGLRGLIEACRLSPGSITSNDIAFRLAPRLNAAGRLATAGEAVELLLADDPAQAGARAARLDALNRDRQRITEQAVALAKSNLGRLDKRDILIAVDEGFHEGVAGLAASRLAEELYRPVLIMRRDGELTKGSARSIPEFHITRALEACADLLQRFGGHESAAGFSLPTVNLPAFQDRLESLAAQRLADANLQPTLELDAQVDLGELDDQVLDFLDRLEPCGQENPYPAFLARGVELLSKRVVGAQGRHLKLTVRQSGRYFDAIAFRLGELAEGLPSRIDLAFQFERNEFRGTTTPQLNVLDIKPSG